MEPTTHTNGSTAKPVPVMDVSPPHEENKQRPSKRIRIKKEKAPAPIMPLAAKPVPGPEPGTIPFTFQNDRLDVVRLPDGDVGVTLRRLCEIVGVSLSSQLKRLNRTSAEGAAWATVVTMTTVAGDGKTREMAILPRESIPMWAVTLNASRCAPGVQLKLLAYQDQAAKALAAAFLPDSLPLSQRFEKTLQHISNRLDALESGGIGTRSMILVPQLDPDHAGYSMESMNRYLADQGYNISASDTAIRSIAAKLRIIGDPTYGFWNSHSDAVIRGAPLHENWRFNEAATQLLQDHVKLYCELRASNEAAGTIAPRDKALTEVLDKIQPVGSGTFELLTRTRSQRRPPFPGITRG